MKKLTFLIIGLSLVILAFSTLPVKAWLNVMLGWFEGFGIWTPVVYFVFFALCSPHIFPVFLLSIGAGMLFDVTTGFVIVSAGNLMTCFLMFVLARYAGRDWCERKLKQYAIVGKINRALENEGWKMLFMLRAVPIVHMIVLNIACGVSKIKVKDYLLGSWLGMVPMLFVYVYFGSLTENIMDASTRNIFDSGVRGEFMVPVIAILVGFGFYMRNVMKKYMVPATTEY